MKDSLSQTFSALADPTRRAVLARLAGGKASVSEIAEPFLDRMSLPAITKHLQVLEKAGLISRTRDAQRRPCELNAEGIRDAVEWMSEYQQMMEGSLDRLDEYLKTMQTKGRKKAQRREDARKPEDQ